jgi:transposase
METTLELLTTSKSGREVHRHWPEKVKAQIVSENLRPGAMVNEVAERHGLKPNHLSTWRTMARHGKLVLPAPEDAIELAAVIVDPPVLEPPIDLDRSTLADWVGRAARELRTVFDALIADLKRSTKLFMDETRAPVLDPGSRKTKTRYFWALARDDRPWSGGAPPGVAFTYAPGRGGHHAERILQGFTGILQVDGYAGYDRLIAPNRAAPDIRLAYCCAHARRKLVEITRNGSAPIAEEGVRRIGELYRIETELRGLPAQARLARRQNRSAPLIADMRTWLTHHRARVAGKSPLGEALAYVAKYWDGLCVFLTDGRIEIDNNTVERTILPIALNRKNAFFAGHDAGAENWAVIASLIETCKLNSVDPFAYLSGTLTAIVNGHKQAEIGELLPWN